MASFPNNAGPATRQEPDKKRHRSRRRERQAEEQEEASIDLGVEGESRRPPKHLASLVTALLASQLAYVTTRDQLQELGFDIPSLESVVQRVPGAGNQPRSPRPAPPPRRQPGGAAAAEAHQPQAAQQGPPPTGQAQPGMIGQPPNPQGQQSGSIGQPASPIPNPPQVQQGGGQQQAEARGSVGRQVRHERTKQEQKEMKKDKQQGPQP